MGGWAPAGYVPFLGLTGPPGRFAYGCGHRVSGVKNKKKRNTWANDL